MSATFQVTRDLGWEYLEKLAKQKIMQVQSSTDPPKKLALGERAVMVDGNEYNALQLKEAGPADRDRLSVGRNADGGRAERDLQERPPIRTHTLGKNYMFTPECRAAHHRCGCVALGPSASEGKSGPQAVQGRQSDEGRRGGRSRRTPSRSSSATARYSAFKGSRRPDDSGNRESKR